MQLKQVQFRADVPKLSPMTQTHTVTHTYTFSITQTQSHTPVNFPPTPGEKHFYLAPWQGPSPHSQPPGRPGQVGDAWPKKSEGSWGEASSGYEVNSQWRIFLESLKPRKP